ncbi:MAG: RND family transporter [SAR324 cluster bacterium]|nr:RND family transporter [SAR324 cluster bacterium]
MIKKIYDRYILEYPVVFLILVLVLIGFLGYEAKKLDVDASAETLMLEDDKDLRYTRQVNSRYDNPDFLIVTYSSKEDLLTDKSLDHLKRLQQELLSLDRVESVYSILNVPLLESPPKPLNELLKEVPTLETPWIDRELARAEFLKSPIYSENLVSADFKTTALQVNLKDDPIWRNLVNRRYELRQKEMDGNINAEEQTELQNIQKDFKEHRNRMRVIEHENVAQVRAIIEKYKDNADLFLGGVSMIADDLITFVKDDLKVFGLGVLLFLIVTMWVIFRQIRWIIIPLLCCALSVIATSGFLGIFGWEVTVISSNFISIQLIITMSLTIHLMVRYRELAQQMPGASEKELVLNTMTSMVKPCFYAIITTVAGFFSLILSGILPIIQFGWMMSTGISVSLILTFVLFPIILMPMKQLPTNKKAESGSALTYWMAHATEKYGRGILISSVVILVVCIVGILKLRVENSFIDYFKPTTEIYQGMKVIDQQLGGTTPLDIVLEFETVETPAVTQPVTSDGSDNTSDFDEFEAEFEESKGEAQYWFTEEKMQQVEKIHDYLESVPEIGKVLSMGTMLKVGKTLNDGEPLDNFKLALIYNELPEKFRKIVLSPYVSVEHNEVRFSVRVRDSDPDLRRNELLHRIHDDLTGKLGFSDKNIHMASMLVLYNNMLQSLFSSQILTLGVVVVSLMVMFMILFQSFKLAVIAISPNILSIGVILGFMGWVGIPLDMMTITIASISVGIAVDDTIHYIHRFKSEFKKDGNYLATMHRCHESIGYAMYYTSVTIIIGFSILVLSNFIPSIYFGALTGLVMVVALIAALTLLPSLIVAIKPLGPETK